MSSKKGTLIQPRGAASSSAGAKIVPRGGRAVAPPPLPDEEAEEDGQNVDVDDDYFDVPAGAGASSSSSSSSSSAAVPPPRAQRGAGAGAGPSFSSSSSSSSSAAKIRAPGQPQKRVRLAPEVEDEDDDDGGAGAAGRYTLDNDEDEDDEDEEIVGAPRRRGATAGKKSASSSSSALVPHVGAAATAAAAAAAAAATASAAAAVAAAASTSRPIAITKYGIRQFVETQHGLRLFLQNCVGSCDLKCSPDLAHIATHARNAEYNPQRFAAVILRLREPKSTALIFASGKMVVTGAKNEDDTLLAARKIAKILTKLGFAASVTGFRIQNMVATGDCGWPIRLEGLADEHSKFSSYEPELFPGLIYRMEAPRMVLLIFVSGKVVVTGAKGRSVIVEGVNKLFPVLFKFRKGTSGGY